MHMFRSSHHLIRISTILAVAFVALAALLISSAVTSNIQAEGGSSGTVCGGPTPAFISQPAEGQPVDGLVHLELYTPTSSFEVTEVEFFRDSEVGLGSGSPVGGNNNIWENQWPSESTANGPHAIYANVVFIDTASTTTVIECHTPHRQINVQNAGTATETKLRINVLPDDSWSGPTNVNFQFQAQAILVDDATNTFVDDVTDVANFSWSTSIGAINPNGSIGNFFSGPVPGEGQILLTAHFDGQNASEEVVVGIFDANNPPAGTDYDDYFGEGGTTTDEPDSGDSDNSTGNTDSSDEPDEPFPIPEDPNKVDYKLAQCLLERLGDEDYEHMLDDQERLTKEQFDEVYGCFSTRRFVIPASIAPVAPNAVLELKEQQHIVRINDHKQAKTQEGADAIQFSGVAEPDSPILIYIFSEPLVLAGQTDSDGNWTYTLEDPLEPGQHEAYVIVDTDEGYVRSSSFGFEVAQAAASDENPYGYSLALAENDTSQLTNYFIVGIVTLVLVASIFLTRFVWFKPHKKAPVAEVAKEILEEPQPTPEVELKAEAIETTPHQPGDTMQPSVEVSPIETEPVAVASEPVPAEPAGSEQESTIEAEDEVPRQL